MGRKLRLVLAGAPLLVTPAVIAVAPYADATACGATSSSNWHVGYATDASSTTMTSLYGISATVDVQDTSNCTGGGSGNFSNIYLMTFSSNFDGWTQVGYEKGVPSSSYPGTHTFGQTYDGGSTASTWYSPGTLATGQTENYKVQDYDSPPYLNQSYGFYNNAVAVTGKTTYWTSRHELEIAGEADYREDDIAGTKGNHVVIKNLKYMNKSNHTWYAMPAGIFYTHSDATKWKHNSVSGTEKDLWTNPTN